jgi:thiosulfate/3-mercaptopyruvate sulfurtransferase
VIAARLVWLLRVLGVDAALLDGGLAAWDGPLSVEPVQLPPAAFTARPWPAERLASIDEATSPGTVLLDARPRERYLGLGDDPVDPRPGHIPGAVSLPAHEHVDASGRLLSADVLRGRLAGAGVVPGAGVVSSCGSGVTACHTLLVMEHVGLGAAGRLFPGSFSQWSRDPARVVATGDEL